MRKLEVIGIAVVVAGLIAVAIAFAPSANGQVSIRMPDRDRLVRLGERALGFGSQIGVAVRDADRADASREKLPAQAGAVIEEVHSGSPAAKAGLRTGDVVVEFDGEKVRGARQFTRLVRETPAGRAVKAAVIRDGRRMEVDLTPESQERATFGLDREPLRRSLEGLGDWGRNLRFDFDFDDFDLRDFDRRGARGRLGVTVEELTPQLADYFGVKDGVLVTSVSDDSPAARAGVKAGDVITTVNDRAVDSATDLIRSLRDEEGREVTLRIVRERKEITVKATVEERRVRRPRLLRGA